MPDTGSDPHQAGNALIAQADKQKAAVELLALADAYQCEDRVAEYCMGWVADCYVATGDYRAALNVFPTIQIDGRSTVQTDRLLTIKACVGAPIGARDVFTLFGPKVTTYARGHLDIVAKYIDAQLTERATREGDLLQRWRNDPATPRHPFGLFSGIPVAQTVSQPDGFGFSYNASIEAFCKSLTRGAENALREDEGMPRVGEGWIEETKLYYCLRGALPDIEVIQHARLKWLGNQHLDIFIPTIMIAIEYQGAQHDRAVEFFGGEAAFEKARQRDARKRVLCKRNGVHLVEVRPGYDFQELLRQIHSSNRGS